MPKIQRIAAEKRAAHGAEAEERFAAMSQPLAGGAGDPGPDELPKGTDPEAHGGALRPLEDIDVKRFSGAGIRVFLGIAKAWGLSTEAQCQLLGDIAGATLRKWEGDQDATLTLDQLERVSHIIAIYRSLHTLLPASADGWVHRPNTNPLFGGAPALNLMTQGGISGLRDVRIFLKAQEGGWC